MCVEIEAKVRVDCLDVVAERLGAIGADRGDEVVHIDAYYDDSGGGLIRSGCGLRLRREIIGGSEKAILTYKGPRQKGRFKKRKEVEVGVTDFETAEKLLAELGYGRELVIEKRRRFWRFNDCAICLDEVPLLGTFVEVEGPGEDVIDEVLGEIGLGGLKHITKGYAGLIKDKLGEIGSKKRDVLFEDE